MFTYIKIWGVLLILMAADSFAQPFRFTRLTVEDGLSQNSVLCVSQDYRGNIWLGTRSGLNRYDASRVTSYKSGTGQSGGLADTYILSLLSDRKKNLWVGTRKGLNRYRERSDDFEPILYLNTKSGAENFPVNCIYEDKSGRIWVGGNNRIYRIVFRNDTPFLQELKTGAYPKWGTVFSFLEDSRGFIWMGTEQGLIRIQETRNGFHLKSYEYPGQGSLYSGDAVTSLAEDGNGYLWIGTLNKGIFLYNSQTEKYNTLNIELQNSATLVNHHVRKLLIDNSNQLWIGTQEGISVLDSSRKKFTTCVNDPLDGGSLSQNSIHSLYKDRQGIIWIGTFFGGVNCYVAQNKNFQTYTNRSASGRLSNNVISSFAQDNNGKIWIGTEGGGLNLLDLNNGKIRQFFNTPSNSSSLSSNLVKAIYKDKDGHIWVGTHGGSLSLVRQQSENISFSKFLFDPINGDAPGLEVSAIAEDESGIFWVGTELKGLQAFKRTGTHLQVDLSYKKLVRVLQRSSITCLTNSPGKLWIGTASNLYFIYNRVLYSLPAFKNVRTNCAQALDTAGVWIGTSDRGLIRINNAGRVIKTYTTQNGLPDNNILGILKDKNGNLWISTGAGLAQLDITTNRMVLYDKNDGLPGNIFNMNAYYQTLAGQMLFGGYDGFILFTPESITNNPVPAPFEVTSFYTEGNPGKNLLLSADDHLNIDLKHNENLFTLEFTSLNFIQPGKNRYACKLEGFDHDWMYTNVPTISYRNIPPGSYTFIAKGSNNDNIWGQEATLKIRISPPVWKTWYAYALYVILFLTVTFFIARYFYLKTLLRKNQELTRFKLNFFTNISHEIRTHLSLILVPAEKLMLDSDRNETDQKQLATIKNNSESLLQLVNELMDFRKVETGHLSLAISKNEFIGFVDQICSSFTDIAAAKQIIVEKDFSPGPLFLWYDPAQLAKVIYNLLSNAFKFTPEEGLVKVQINNLPEEVQICISNSGQGIAAKNLERIFDNYFQEQDNEHQNTGYGIGLAFSKAIVELHHGKIEVSCQPSALESNNVLTSFTLFLKKGNQHYKQEELLKIGTTEPFNLSPPPFEFQSSEKETSNNINIRPTTLGTILVVEDNESIRRLIRESLGDAYIILEAVEGASGLEAAVENIPDIIISDIMMPVMNGLALCENLKTDMRTSHIPVILLTAKNSETNHISGLETGADIYLTKPFSINILRLQIRNLMIARERIRARISESMKIGADYSLTPEVVQPNDPSSQHTVPELHPLDQAFLQNIIAITSKHLENPDFGVAMLSKQLGMSQPVLFKKTKAITGMTTNDFVKSIRIKKACDLLLEKRYTVYEIAYMVGYENSKYFSREFKKQTGKSPSEYIQNRRGD